MKFSPRLKFIAITIDEVLLVIFAIVAVYYFMPQYLIPAILIAICGTGIFVAAKYYLVYSVLADERDRYAFVGMIGRVVTTVTHNSGKIKVGGEIWEARSEVETLEPGTDVVVVSREGMHLRVASQARQTRL